MASAAASSSALLAASIACCLAAASASLAASISASSSATLFTYLKSKTWLSVQNPEFGDIIFYGKPQITHVAYFLGSGFIIESSGGDKNTNTPQKAASKNAFVKLRQYDYRDDIYAILREGNNVLSLKR